MINTTAITDKTRQLAGIAPCSLIFSEVNRFYFTGFAATDGALLVTPEGWLFYTDSRYTLAANEALGAENVHDSAKMYEELDCFFNEYGISTVAIENDRLTISELERLSDRFPDICFDTTSALSRKIDELRSVKSTEEKELILKAQKIAEQGFDYMLDKLVPGKTERELQLMLDFFLLSHGADALSFDTILVSGETSSKPHGVPGSKKLQKGDFITMDFGAVVNGYHSDMTRTVILGSPTLRQREVYETVAQAQLQAISVIQSGVSCFEADKAARDVIADKGYGKLFGHGTGHGVGVEIHEAPNLSPRSKAVLQEGNVVTVEPGIYIPNEYGVRIEDMVYVTRQGNENLTHCEKKLIIL